MALLACVVISPARADPMASQVDTAVLKRGKILWLHCAACHDLERRPRGSAADGALSKIGPHLQGVVGQRAGAVEGFPYSEALRSAGVTWDLNRLDQWLRDPASVIPGTLMVFAGIPSAADRRALLRYLEEATRAD
jgi:cytochrome c